MITIKDADAAWDVIRNAQREMASAQEQLKHYDDEQQDLLHDLELNDHDYHECARLAKELKAVRRKRRELKNRCEVLAPLAEYVKTNQDTLYRFGEVLGKMRKAEDNTKKRLYMCRGDRRGEIIGGDKKNGHP